MQREIKWKTQFLFRQQRGLKIQWARTELWSRDLHKILSYDQSELDLCCEQFFYNKHTYMVSVEHPADLLLVPLHTLCISERPHTSMLQQNCNPECVGTYSKQSGTRVCFSKRVCQDVMCYVWHYSVMVWFATRPVGVCTQHTLEQTGPFVHRRSEIC